MYHLHLSFMFHMASVVSDNVTVKEPNQAHPETDCSLFIQVGSFPYIRRSFNREGH